MFRIFANTNLELNGKRDGGAVLLGCFSLIGVFGLLAAFQPFGCSKVQRSFFDHPAFSFGIGPERSFYYEIDTPLKIPVKSSFG